MTNVDCFRIVQCLVQHRAELKLGSSCVDLAVNDMTQGCVLVDESQWTYLIVWTMSWLISS